MRSRIITRVLVWQPTPPPLALRRATKHVRDGVPLRDLPLHVRPLETEPAWLCDRFASLNLRPAFRRRQVQAVAHGWH